MLLADSEVIPNRFYALRKYYFAIQDLSGFFCLAFFVHGIIPGRGTREILFLLKLEACQNSF